MRPSSEPPRLRRPRLLARPRGRAGRSAGASSSEGSARSPVCLVLAISRTPRAATAHVPARMSRRSGHRFADKDMRKIITLEYIPIPQERDVLQRTLKGPI